LSADLGRAAPGVFVDVPAGTVRGGECYWLSMEHVMLVPAQRRTKAPVLWLSRFCRRLFRARDKRPLAGFKQRSPAAHRKNLKLQDPPVVRTVQSTEASAERAASRPDAQQLSTSEVTDSHCSTLFLHDSRTAVDSTKLCTVRRTHPDASSTLAAAPESPDRSLRLPASTAHASPTQSVPRPQSGSKPNTSNCRWLQRCRQGPVHVPPGSPVQFSSLLRRPEARQHCPARP
jgi:hypothetical protein